MIAAPTPANCTLRPLFLRCRRRGDVAGLFGLFVQEVKGNLGTIRLADESYTSQGLRRVADQGLSNSFSPARGGLLSPTPCDFIERSRVESQHPCERWSATSKPVNLQVGHPGPGLTYCSSAPIAASPPRPLRPDSYGPESPTGLRNCPGHDRPKKSARARSRALSLITETQREDSRLSVSRDSILINDRTCS